MMNTQQSSLPARAFAGHGSNRQATRELRAGRVVQLGLHGGEVRVLSGRAWLTTPNDLCDHVLGAGESFLVEGNGPTVLEAWEGGAPVLFAWRPRSLAERARGALARGRATVLHNAGTARDAFGQGLADDSSTRYGPRRPARQARGCAAGAA